MGYYGFGLGLKTKPNKPKNSLASEPGCLIVV